MGGGEEGAASKVLLYLGDCCTLTLKLHTSITVKRAFSPVVTTDYLHRLAHANTGLASIHSLIVGAALQFLLNDAYVSCLTRPCTVGAHVNVTSRHIGVLG